MDKIVESYSLSRQDLERFSFDLWSELIQNVDILYFEQGGGATVIVAVFEASQGQGSVTLSGSKKSFRYLQFDFPSV